MIEFRTAHEDDYATVLRAGGLAFQVARAQGLPLRMFEAKRRPSGGTLGLCYVEEGRVSVLFRHKAPSYLGGQWWPHPLAWGVVLDTVAHELAHLCNPRHDAAHKAETRRLLALLEAVDREKGS